jgi:predicted component of viral defense system (DUF524 family)
VHTADEVDDAEQAAERRGMFHHADLYKMHAYRDAISTAHTVWILYPGTELRFFDEAHGRIDCADDLHRDATGVGAIPLQPGGPREEIARALARLLA